MSSRPVQIHKQIVARCAASVKRDAPIPVMTVTATTVRPAPGGVTEQLLSDQNGHAAAAYCLSTVGR
jgi:hypothetical protein